MRIARPDPDCPVGGPPPQAGPRPSCPDTAPGFAECQCRTMRIARPDPDCPGRRSAAIGRT
eukprot:10490300-Alexandrium_andersonii.AAC.1